MSDQPPLIVRPLETRADCAACVDLQRKVWGHDFVDIVPATLLTVSQRVGGVAAGAFDTAGRLIGFVFGITGVRDGELVHWSHMLAVHPNARRQGVGRRLKAYQRQLLLERSVEVAYWSFDPLRAGNAHFNLNVLGARPTEYVVDMYGDTKSVLHGGLETDRLVAEWTLRSTDVEVRLGGARPELPLEAHCAPISNPLPLGNAAPDRPRVPFPDDQWVRVAVPADIDRMKSTPDVAQRRQLAVCLAFEWYFERSYAVVGFQADRDPDAPWYALTTQATRTS